LAILKVTTARQLKAMSEEQLKTFLEAVKADAGLQEKLKAAKDAAGVVAIAKAAGFVISAEELQKTQAELSELSDVELEGVAGGAEPPFAGIHLDIGRRRLASQRLGTICSV
jgi:predicted ribosomally synthesized peptide with nif11-like leader